MVGTRHPQDDSPESVVVRFLNLMGTGEERDRQAALNLFADDAILWIAGNLPYSGTHLGRVQIIEKVYRPAKDRYVPGSKSLQIGTIVASGDRVAVEWTSKRKMKTGQDYQNFLCGIFEVRGGKIHSMREYLDTLHAKENNWPDQTKAGQ